MAKKQEAIASQKGDVTKVKSVSKSLSDKAYSDLLKKMEVVGDSSEEGDGVLNTVDWWNIESGEEAKIVLLEMSTNTKTGEDGNAKTSDTVIVVTENSERKETQLNNLVNFARANQEKMPFAVHVVCTGMKTSANGRDYKNIEIRNVK